VTPGTKSAAFRAPLQWGSEPHAMVKGRK